MDFLWGFQQTRRVSSERYLLAWAIPMWGCHGPGHSVPVADVSVQKKATIFSGLKLGWFCFLESLK
jgi:hypothetical protein